MLAILHKIIKFNKITVLGIVKTESGYVLNSITVKKSGAKLNIVDINIYDDLHKFIENVDKNIPVLLLVDGKGIINKKVDLKNEADVSWKKNMDFSSIYCTEYKVLDILFLSFCRKETFDPLIVELQVNNIQIVSVGIGPAFAVLLQPVIMQDRISSNGTVLNFENNLLQTIQKNPENSTSFYTIGSTQLNMFQLPLYGIAIKFFLKEKNFATTMPDQINAEEIIYKQAFKSFGIAILTIFFTTLLLSYISIQHYNSKNIQLNQENIYSGQTYKHIVSLENQIEQKRKILNETGQMSKNFLTYYSYELVKSVPNELQIDELNIFPILSEMKENKKIVLDSNVIVVKGFTISDSAFNTWLGDLKHIRWISKFEIISLKKDKKNIQQFELKILLNNV